MREKQLDGPIVTTIVAIVIVLVVGAGYYYMNKDSLGKAGEAVKYNRPGVVPQGANLKLGPFPGDNKGNASKNPAYGSPTSGQQTGG